MKKDLLITFITEFLILVGGILVYKLAASFLGKEGFSEYVLSRRIISPISQTLLMGLGVGIPRYLALASAGPNSKKPDTYFIGGVSVLFLVLLTFTIIFNLFKDTFAFLMFGNSSYFYLIFPINLMLIGLILHYSCYSYFRGKLLMFRANILQLINMGFVPLLAFSLCRTTREVLSVTGLSWLIVALLFLILILKNLQWKNTNIVPYIKELLAYGLQRVPGDFGIDALLALPAIITTHIAGVKEAGYVAFGISLLNMMGSAFAPIGLILLPKASQIIESRDPKLLRCYITKVLQITLFLTTLGVVFFEIFADKIIDLYLGESFSDLVLVAKIIIIGSLAYTIYVSMRSIIDAYYVKAINMMNIITSLLLFLILSGIVILLTKNYMYITISFTAAIFVLGSLTLLSIRRILKRINYEY